MLPHLANSPLVPHITGQPPRASAWGATLGSFSVLPGGGRQLFAGVGVRGKDLHSAGTRAKWVGPFTRVLEKVARKTECTSRYLFQIALGRFSSVAALFATQTLRTICRLNANTEESKSSEHCLDLTAQPCWLERLFTWTTVTRAFQTKPD